MLETRINLGPGGGAGAKRGLGWGSKGDKIGGGGGGGSEGGPPEARGRQVCGAVAVQGAKPSYLARK